ncbi:MAG TPA: galactokinase family protein, partial [Planctomycetota bacterium]|nr:galactokinase family protein [Planctomycetota bacterium]
MPERATATAKQWLEGLSKRDTPLFARLAEACGGVDVMDDARRDTYRRALERFAARFGASRPVSIVRVPGRLNVLGRHADHRGGFVNPVALAQEAVLVYAPGDDDRVDVENLDPGYGRRAFRIGDHRPDRPIRDNRAWLDWTQALAARRAREGSAHDWVHKLAAPPAYLAHFLCPGREIRGLSGVLAADVPPRRGLSSSSAIVIAMMLATVDVNAIPLEPAELVSHCGVAEWYVGTRGGCGDHAAILCARRGHLTRVRTVPALEVAGYIPFPDEYRLLVCHSGHDADKTGAASNTFNERVAAYEIADLFAARFLREQHPVLWDDFTRQRVHRGDEKPVHMGDLAECLDAQAIYDLLETVPERATREEIRRALPDETDALERQFATHRELPGGYRLRGVLTFGIAECVRSARGPDLLARGDVETFARWMNVSHDGDRVSGAGWDARAMGTRIDPSLEVWEQPGGYACSTPEIDAMVDIARSAGAIGAQLTAAGLGGSMMALVVVEREADVVGAMEREYFRPRGITPNHLEAVPSAGARLV